MMRATLLLALFLKGCGRSAPMELWYWHHSYIVSSEALAKSEALADRAAAAGYTGLALWDSSLIFLNEPDWPSANTFYLKRFIDYAQAKGLTVMPAILPYGHSDDVLKHHPDWAEGQRVIGVKFRRSGDGLKLVPAPLIPFENGRFLVEPWHQYRVSFAPNASGPVGARDDRDAHLVRLDDEAHPGATEFVFNSAASSRIHIFGPTGFRLEEAALVRVQQREGAPYTVREGDFTLIDYYAVTSVYGEGVGMCLTEPAVQRWAADNARQVAELLPADSPLFLQHDEMRHMNSCAGCRRLNKSAGELLAWSLRGLIPTLPRRKLYIWSDMFDPWHNAREHFYYVEGDLRGSWEGLPVKVTVMNWNAAHRRASLEFFAGRGHAQVIAGYYDPDGKDGARAARVELSAANGIRGIAGLMYTTWKDDYSQLEAYARGARAQWPDYISSRPW